MCGLTISCTGSTPAIFRRTRPFSRTAAGFRPPSRRFTSRLRRWETIRRRQAFRFPEHHQDQYLRPGFAAGHGVISRHSTAGDRRSVHAAAYPLRVNAGGQLILPGLVSLPGTSRWRMCAPVFPVPNRPEWFRDVQPIMAEFAQLYPMMSRYLSRFRRLRRDGEAPQATLARIRALDRRPQRHAGHARPVREQAQDIVKWLQTETGDPAAPLVKGTPGHGSHLQAAPTDARRSPMAVQARCLRRCGHQARYGAVVRARDRGGAPGRQPIRTLTMLKIDRQIPDRVRAATSADHLFHPVQAAIRLEYATVPPYLTAISRCTRKRTGRSARSSTPWSSTRCCT